MLQSISELLVLTSTRLSRRPLHRFDVAESSEPACRARLLEVLGDDALLAGQFHVLSRDSWHVLWTPGRRAFVAFHDRPFALVAWRDPVGPEDTRAAAMHLFRAYASTIGKHAIVLGASEAARDQSPAFGAIWIGAEQRFDLAAFHTKGKAGAKLRLAMNHVLRTGAVAREIDPLGNERDRTELRAVEQAWKAARPARRIRSFLRTEPMENARHRRYFAVETGATMQAFLVCSPVSRRGAYLQDLVRHPDAPRGAAELVTVHALETMKREGLEFATAGIVPFYDPKGRRPASTLGTAADWCIAHFDRLYRFSGLKQFRAKFAAAQADPTYVLHWPMLTPLAIWDLASVLSPR